MARRPTETVTFLFASRPFLRFDAAVACWACDGSTGECRAGPNSARSAGLFARIDDLDVAGALDNLRARSESLEAGRFQCRRGAGEIEALLHSSNCFSDKIDGEGNRFQEEDY